MHLGTFTLHSHVRIALKSDPFLRFPYPSGFPTHFYTVLTCMLQAPSISPPPSDQRRTILQAVQNMKLLILQFYLFSYHSFSLSLFRSGIHV
jgi:hypothetical protein